MIVLICVEMRLISACSRLFIAVTLNAAVSSSLSHAQSEAELRHWLEAEFQRASLYPGVDGVAVRFDELFHSKKSPEELYLLKQQVVGKPDHPGRQEIKSETRRQAAGADVREWTIWTTGPGNWRINHTARHQPELPYVDRVRRDDQAWMLTDESLALVNTANPPSGRDIAGYEGMLLVHLGDLFHGGLAAGGPETPTFEDIVITSTPAKWMATRRHTFNDKRVVIRFYGRWDSAAARAFIERWELVESPARDANGMSQTYADWRHDEKLGRWVSGRIDKLDPAGKLVESLVFRSSVPFSAEDFDQMTRTPTLAQADPIRGVITVRKIDDFRSTPARWQTVADGAVTDTGLATDSRPTDRFPWRRIGWGFAILIIASLVVIRLRRS